MDATTPARMGQSPRSPDPDRDRRIAAIRDGAIARQNLGQSVGHILLPDGRHQIFVLDAPARRIITYTGDTLEAVIDAAKRGSR